MNSISGVAVASESWCDVKLADISWCSDGRDLVLTFDMRDNKKGKLTCTWAHAQNINLVSGKNEGGFPLSYGASMVKDGANGWLAVFDFAGRGVVELKCNDLILEL